MIFPTFGLSMLVRNPTHSAPPAATSASSSPYEQASAQSVRASYEAMHVIGTSAGIGVMAAAPIALEGALASPSIAEGVGGSATAGGEGEAASSVLVRPGKWDYVFGPLTSGAHNTSRSLQNAKDLSKLDFDEAVGGQDALMNFQESHNLAEAGRVTNAYGVTVTRTARIGDIGAIDIKYFFPGGNMAQSPEVSTIIPKIFK